MANVKFYRLGRNNGVSNASYLEYQVEDGRIVFALVKGDTPSDPLEHYIWSNGIEYHIADASSLKEIENQLTILLDGAPIDTSIGKMIQDALDGYELTAENFVKLVDSSNSNVQVRVVDSSLVLTAPGSHVSIDVSTCDPEVYYLGLNPAHGDYYVKEEIITEKVGAEPRRTAYIYNADLAVWQVLDGNVDATNVFFKDGIDRTAAIGVLPATTGGEIETEGKTMNLKELLEYYLVEELYKGDVHNATFNTPAWSIVGGNNATPKDLKNYVKIDGTVMSATSALIEVGSTVSIDKIEVKAVPAYNGAITSYNGTAAYINNMFKYSPDGTTTSIVDDSSIYGVKPSTEFINSSNFSTATATLSLDVTNFSVIASTASSDLANSSVAIGSMSETIGEGTHTMTLSYSNNLSASREMDSVVSATTVSVYPVSNKNNVSTGQLTANGILTPTDGNASASNAVTKGNTSVTLKAVYPLYTNGDRIAATPLNNAQTGEDGAFTTNTIDGVTCIKYGTLFDYTGATKTTAKNTIVYIRFGNVENDNRIIYIPANSDYSVELIEALGFNGVSKAHDEPLTSKWHIDTNSTVSINGLNYNSIKETFNDGPSGKKELKITLSYKKKQ